MVNFKKIVYSSLIATICGLNIQASSDIKEGEQLFREANCQKCHILDGEFDKMNEKVQNIKNLASWVSTCDNSLQVGWFPKEQEKVTKYLNETYYKLEK